jgi:NAD(P)-dependent dehydrogenase (short-subunit alcohol dehydrogenase family)
LESIMSDLSGRTTIVVGASRGLGRGIATALAEAGAPVIAVSRTAAAFPDIGNGSGSIQPEIADASEATVPATLIDRHEPQNIILVAGATPHMRPLRQHTWETFSVNWHTDVRITFHWLREILLTPLRPGGRVVVFSSGAAIAGSPLSGGYAGTNATQKIITGYAQGEADQLGLDITFTAVLPRMSPDTELGRSAAHAYASAAGLSIEDFLKQFGPTLTPEIAGNAVADLVWAEAGTVAPAYLLTGAGLKKLA